MYDFDEVIDRSRSNSMKWGHARLLLTQEQCAANPLPMWVADMDFRVAPPIAEALRRELEFGVLGYGGTPDSYREAAVDWQARRFGWQAKPEWLTQSPGVISALNMAIQAFSEPGDYVLVQTPVYFHIHADVVANGRHLACAPLAFDEGTYRFDPLVFEAAIRPGTKLFILCNPHNPTGNVWTREELLTMASICARHDILVISDEVHQDLVFGVGKVHVPFAMLGDSVAQNVVVCTAPSKTFNVAGLSCANIFIPNDRFRQAYRTQSEKNGAFLVNTMGTAACEAAYRHGEAWADAVLEYIRGNQEYFAQRVKELGLPLTVTPTGALYLAWIDFRRLGMPPTELHDFLLRKARLWLDQGSKFGSDGEGFMRINLACSRSLVDEALVRLTGALA
ncbi:pyridoxal phosphate-dependent aminotransferase [Variovorax beijingensis]|uniref:cysteine-S-conjugate beta-lyase n=1 Tax=Variovorax beijingensis TaxID=2496117 RepID=A0A3P3E666_9BURK|nr:MalY/PatB family protein [Variovorax beijingensis]RRH81172.1 pyridoxal phosphate-dependent aminotransferase [Variovorax beijingensis]